MARLFVTEREFDFISDINKELIKDVSDQKIFYYAISEIKTTSSETYGEALNKIYDDPIAIEALVDNPQWETQNETFSPDNTVTIVAYIQFRDLIEKGIELKVGDYFSFGSVFYECVSVNPIRSIFGQVEHIDGYTLNGIRSRMNVFQQKNIQGPISEKFNDPNATQENFVQQRGYAENRLGKTGDVRDLQRRGVLEEPLTGQREVSSNGTQTGAGRSFYDE